MRRNGLSHGYLYMQVTRGVAPRDHKFPTGTTPALVMTTRQTKPLSPDLLSRGVLVVTTPDIRWKRCDIKSVSLLPNVLSKQVAVEAGAYEAWLVDADGLVTEGASTNACFSATSKGRFVARKSTSGAAGSFLSASQLACNWLALK